MSFALRKGTRANDTLVADTIRTHSLTATTQTVKDLQVDNLQVNNRTSISENLYVDGDTTIGGSVGISGSTQIDGSIDVLGGMNVSGGGTIGGALDVVGDLGVGGDATFDASVNILGNLVIQGDLTVVQESTLSETTYIHNDIFYTVAQTIEEPSTFYKQVTICGQLDVSGDASFNTIICHDRIQFPSSQIRITEDASSFVNQGTDVIAIGKWAGISGQGNESIALGTLAGENSQGARSVAVGSRAGSLFQGADTVAVGNSAGLSGQNDLAVAVGFRAGENSQGARSVAVGSRAGSFFQGADTVAVGNSAGLSGQNDLAVAVGFRAGAVSQGQHAVAIGHKAGETNQPGDSIILNAQNTELDTTTSGFFVKPIREQENLSGWIPPGTVWHNKNTGELASQPDITTGEIEVDLTVSGSLGINRAASDGNVFDVSGDGRVRGDFRVDGSFNIGPETVTMWEDVNGNLTMAHSSNAGGTPGLNINLYDESDTILDSGGSSRGIVIGPKDVAGSTIHISKEGKVGIGKRIEGNPSQYKTLDVSGDVEIDGKLFIHNTEIGVSGVDTEFVNTRELRLYNQEDDDAAVVKLATFTNTYGSNETYDRLDVDLTHGFLDGSEWLGLKNGIEHTVINHGTLHPTIHARLPPNHGWYGTKLHHVNYDLMCDTRALDTGNNASYGIAGRDFYRGIFSYSVAPGLKKYASFDVVLPAWLDGSNNYAFPEGTRVTIYGKGLPRGPNGQRTFLRIIVPSYNSDVYASKRDEALIHLNIPQISTDISYGLARYIDESSPGPSTGGMSRTKDSNSVWIDLTSIPAMKNLEIRAWMRDTDSFQSNNYPEYAPGDGYSPGRVPGFSEGNTKNIWKCECVSTTYGWVLDRFTVTNGNGDTTIPQSLNVRKDATVGGKIVANYRDFSQSQSEAAINTLTYGQPDIYMGVNGGTQDLYGYTLTANVGPDDDLGLYIKGRDGINIGANIHIATFFSISAGNFPSGRHGLKVNDLLEAGDINVDVGGSLFVGGDTTLSGDLGGIRAHSTSNGTTCMIDCNRDLQFRTDPNNGGTTRMTIGVNGDISMENSLVVNDLLETKSLSVMGRGLPSGFKSVLDMGGVGISGTVLIQGGDANSPGGIGFHADKRCFIWAGNKSGNQLGSDWDDSNIVIDDTFTSRIPLNATQINATQNVTVGGTLTSNGSLNATQNVTVGGTLTSNGSLNATQNVTVGGTLTSNGPLNATQNVTVRGTLTSNGDIIDFWQSSSDNRHVGSLVKKSDAGIDGYYAGIEMRGALGNARGELDLSVRGGEYYDQLNTERDMVSVRYDRVMMCHNKIYGTTGYPVLALGPGADNFSTDFVLSVSGTVRLNGECRFGNGLGSVLAFDDDEGYGPIDGVVEGTGSQSLYNFTAGHDTYLVDDVPMEQFDGFIISSTGKSLRYTRNYEYLMFTTLSTCKEDTACAGVYYYLDPSSYSTDPDVNSEYVEDIDMNGVYERSRYTQITNKKIVKRPDINGRCISIGEGTIWVCEENGSISNGDYITTSSIPGIGMRQDSSQLHNYTVAKAYTDCDFNLLIEVYSVPKTEEIITTETRKKIITTTISESYEEMVDTSGNLEIPVTDSSGNPLRDSSGNPIFKTQWFSNINKKVTKYRNKEIKKVIPIHKKIPLVNEDGTFLTFQDITEYEMETITISNEEPIMNEDGTPMMVDVSEEAYIRKWVMVYDDKYIVYNDSEYTNVYCTYPYDFSTHNPDMIGKTFRCARIGCTYHCG